MLESKRSLYLKKNTFWSLVLQVTSIVCSLILPRFILGEYGSEVNGLISSITQFLGFISLCELGVGAVVPANLYRPIAEKDMDKVSAVVASAQRFYRIIAFILIGYVLTLVGFYPILVSDSFDFIFTVSIIFIIAIATFARYFFGIAYTLLLKSYQKQYIPFILESTTLILNLIISIILIKCGFSIITVKLVSSIIFIMRPLFITAYVKKNYKLNLKIKYEGEPIKQKWNGMAQHFALVVQEKADTVILTFLSTLTCVSVYGIYHMIVNGIKSLLNSLTIGFSSYLGDILASDESSALRKAFSKFEWVTHTASTYLFSVAGILAVPFVKVYTSGLPDSGEYITPVFSAVICCAFAVGCIQLPYNTLVQVAGHFRQTQASAIVEPSMNIVISVLLVSKFGLVGVAIGTLVSMLYRLIYLSVYLVKNIIHITPKGFVKQIFIDLLSSGAMLISVSWLRLTDTSYIGWILLALPVALICLAVCLLINLIFYKELLISNIKPILNKFRRCK